MLASSDLLPYFLLFIVHFWSDQEQWRRRKVLFAQTVLLTDKNTNGDSKRATDPFLISILLTLE